MPKNQRKILAPLVLLLYIGSPRAETPDWEVVINFPMAWLPDISGEISVAGDSTDVEIPIGDLLGSFALTHYRATPDPGGE